MMVPDYQFEALKAKFMQLEVKAAMAAHEFNRQMAVRALNVILRWTPPNAGSRSPQRPGQAGIRQLRARIRTDLTSDKPLASVPQRRKNGNIRMGSKEGIRGHGGFPFVLVKRGKTRRGQITPPLSDPASIIAKYGKWKQVHGVVHMLYEGPDDTEFWVDKKALNAEIKRRQEHAGELISGWYPAARHLRMSTLASYSPGGHTQSGSCRDIPATPRKGNLPQAGWQLSVTNSVKTSPLVARWIQSNMAQQLDARIAMAQAGLFVTRIKALANQYFRQAA